MLFFTVFFFIFTSRNREEPVTPSALHAAALANAISSLDRAEAAADEAEAAAAPLIKKDGETERRFGSTIFAIRD